MTLQFRPGYDGKTSISRWLVEAQVSPAAGRRHARVLESTPYMCSHLWGFHMQLSGGQIHRKCPPWLVLPPRHLRTVHTHTCVTDMQTYMHTCTRTHQFPWGGWGLAGLQKYTGAAHSPVSGESPLWLHAGSVHKFQRLGRTPQKFGF